MRQIDLTGQRFNRWFVVGVAAERSNKGHVLWECRCDCGAVKNIFTGNLKRGISGSCGCFKKDNEGKASIIHGFTGHPLHNIWRGMLSRCRNMKDKDYGGRGIRICQEWQDDFVIFYNWATSNGYKKGLQIERNDNDGNYSPANCRWATAKEQARNRRSSRIITCRGMTMTLSAFAELVGEDKCLIHYRMRHGWTEEEAIFTPFKRRKCKNSKQPKVE